MILIFLVWAHQSTTATLFSAVFLLEGRRTPSERVAIVKRDAFPVLIHLILEEIQSKSPIQSWIESNALNLPPSFYPFEEGSMFYLVFTSWKKAALIYLGFNAIKKQDYSFQTKINLIIILLLKYIREQSHRSEW